MTYIFDNVVVSENKIKSRYVVRLVDEEVIIQIKKEQSEKIALSCDEEAYIIAILLAYIECFRISTRTDVERGPSRISEEQLTSTIPILWGRYHDNLIEIIKQLSYREIRDIIIDENPLELLEERI